MLYVVHNESSNVPYGADFAALIAPVSIPRSVNVPLSLLTNGGSSFSLSFVYVI